VPDRGARLSPSFVYLYDFFILTLHFPYASLISALLFDLRP
jgi:hypothetical protein